jgi:hypothetical protein
MSVRLQGEEARGLKRHVHGFAQVTKNESSRPCTAINSAGAYRRQPDDYNYTPQCISIEYDNFNNNDTAELRLLVSDNKRYLNHIPNRVQHLLVLDPDMTRESQAQQTSSHPIQPVQASQQLEIRNKFKGFAWDTQSRRREQQGKGSWGELNCQISSLGARRNAPHQ